MVEPGICCQPLVGGNGGAGAEATVTFAVAAADPPGPIQVSVKGLLAAFSDGDGSAPAVAFAPFHVPDAVQPVVLVLVHVNAALPPAARVFGVAVSDTVGGNGAGAGGAPTVTATDFATEPAGPTQVSVYVPGITLAYPLASRKPFQEPVAMQLVASVVDQFKIAADPVGTAVGVAVKVSVGGAHSAHAKDEENSRHSRSRIIVIPVLR